MSTPTTSLLQILASAGQGAMEGYDYGHRLQLQREDRERSRALADADLALKLGDQQGLIASLTRAGVKADPSSYFQRQAEDRAAEQKRLADAAERQRRADEQATLATAVDWAQKGVPVQAAREYLAAGGMTEPTFQVKEKVQVPARQQVDLTNLTRNNPILGSLLGNATSAMGTRLGPDGKPLMVNAERTVDRPMLDTIQPKRKIERTVDLGDRVTVYYSDGTSETQTKAAAPTTAKTTNPKTIVRTVNLGDRVQIFYADGTSTIQKKGATPRIIPKKDPKPQPKASYAIVTDEETGNVWAVNRNDPNDKRLVIDANQ